MTTETERINIQIKFKDAEETFEGTPEEAWLLIDRFFSNFIPSFEMARKLCLNVDVQTLARDCEGLIGFSPEGSNVLVPKDKLTDNERLALWLLSSYLGYRLNLLSTDSLSKGELHAILGKSSKIMSTRLGELVKAGLAAKTVEEKFRITTYGVIQMQQEVLPRIIAKASI